MRRFVVIGWMALAGCGESVQTGVTEPSEALPGAPTDIEEQVLIGASGARWTMTGQPLDARSAPLQSVPGHNAFWFAWSVFHPGTSVFGRTAPIDGAPVAGDGRCTVPCEEIQPACPGRDCIPSLTSPSMVSADAPALDYLRDEDEVMGVLTPEGPRAYPHNILWWHEIVNEAVGGETFAITYCPLTGSGLAFDRSGFLDGEVVELGVSGNLYNSNLTMYDRTSRSWWSQMRVESVLGPTAGQRAPLLPVFEMRWDAWRRLYPRTTVVSRDTGHSRAYDVYPYGGYRTDPSNTFRTTNPAPDPSYPLKAMTFGVFAGGAVRGYPWTELESAVGARRGVIADDVGGVALVIVFDLDARYVHAFETPKEGAPIQLERAP